MRRVGGFFKDVAFPALVAAWVAYLGYGAIAGAAGYRNLTDLKLEAEQKRIELEELRERRMTLAQRADQLNPKSLNPDMIDERIRAVLGYASDGDIVIPADEVKRLLKEAETKAE